MIKVNQEIKLNNGKVEIITKKEHEFSDVEKKILKVLALNGYFSERGETSLLTKEDKVKLSLDYGVDIVVELLELFSF